jgi:hypothetical protein
MEPELPGGTGPRNIGPINAPAIRLILARPDVRGKLENSYWLAPDRLQLCIDGLFKSGEFVE